MLGPLRLHHIFFLHLLGAIFFLFLAFLATSYYLIHTERLSSSEEMLKEKILMAERTVGASQGTLLVEVLRQNGDRVTLIAENGTVLAETHEDKNIMENHLQRPEVMASNRQTFGTAVRWSATKKRDYLYVCRKIGENGELYLRVAKDLSYIQQEINSFWLTGTVIFGLALLLALGATWQVSRRVRDQVGELENYLGQLERKNFRAPLNNVGFAAEFMSIAKKMLLLSRRLAKKEQSKTVYISKLKQKNRQITDIIDAISHEFKNPVAAIMGYCETLMADKEIDPKIMARFLEKIHANSQTIAQMIDRLSLSLKFESQHIAPQLAVFDLTALCSEVGAMLSQKYKGRPVQIEGEAAAVKADRTMIYLVLVNLIDNALKYSKDEVIVRITPTGEERLRVSVRDHGLGIAPEEIKNITKKFYRVDKHSWDNSLGIGLSLVDYVLKMHASALVIQSEPGEGSEFSFELEAQTGA